MITSLMMLALEANRVVALRMTKLMRGGRNARREAKLMVSEKICAAFESSSRLAAGASGDEIVHRYRQLVAANARRLGKFDSGRSRKAHFQTNTTPTEVSFRTGAGACEHHCWTSAQN
jgi:hypothetical protein